MQLFLQGGRIVTIDQEFLTLSAAFYDETDRNGKHEVELQAGPVFVTFQRVRPHLAGRWHDLAFHFGELAPFHLVLIAQGVRKSLGDDRVELRLERGWDMRNPQIASTVSSYTSYSRNVFLGVDLLA
jgi:hypothetical protein